MEDSKIIELYFQRSEDAIVQTDKKYGKYCYAIAYNILKDSSDSQECVNDTYLKVWDNIPPAKPSRFSAFIGKLTRNISIDRLRRSNAQKRISLSVSAVFEEVDEMIADNNIDIHDKVFLSNTINTFLASLSPKDRKIFVMRYWYMYSSADIGKEMRMSDGSVRMKLSRMRKAFKNHLEKEGVEL
jgi:RNA polymerase sigma-70 factor (ECF subfamily)